MEVDNPEVLQKGQVNQCLPPSYSKLLGDEAILHLKQIKADLTLAVSLRDLSVAKGIFHKINL